MFNMSDIVKCSYGGLWYISNIKNDEIYAQLLSYPNNGTDRAVFKGMNFNEDSVTHKFSKTGLYRDGKDCLWLISRNEEHKNYYKKVLSRVVYNGFVCSNGNEGHVKVSSLDAFG